MNKDRRVVVVERAIGGARRKNKDYVSMFYIGVVIVTMLIASVLEAVL